jgi:polysaccharide chain length determinant protein (PEP-CTERM system associated)
MIPGKTYTYDDYLRILWRRKWLILLPFLTVSIGTFLVVKRLPNLYQSTTTILVVPQRVPDSYVHSTVTAKIEDRLQSIGEQILSVTRLQRVITEFDLYRVERQTQAMEDVIEMMRRAVQVHSVRGDSFTLSYTCNDARIAQLVTQRLASMFIEENLRDRVVLAEGTSEFLEAQLGDARLRLIEHEKKLEAYRQRYDGELPSQLQSNLQLQHNAETQLQSLVDSLSRDRDQKLLQERLLADLQAPGAAPAVVAGSAPTPVASAADQLEAARATLAQLEQRLTPNHPDVVRAKRVVRDLEPKAALEASGRPADVAPVSLTPTEIARRNKINELQLTIQNLSQSIAKKESEQRRLTNVITTVQSHIAAVPTRESELAELMRDYETLQKTYTSLLSRKEDSKIAADLERRQVGEQFKVLDPARVPERPISPKRVQLDLAGVAFGLILGFGLTAILEYLDTSLKTEDDVVGALMLPVLALIPLMANEEEMRRRRIRRAVFVSCIAAAAVLTIFAGAWKFDALRWVR